ncbi:hypothetical protein SAMN05216223_106276 [Actinacidiphila yanglinensis]|uniref:ABC-2 family transporter protein n=1 Tax=Actinacidiphila yanglinensis TaxID=310779 RepID=A0A1H6B6J4_9ACTN|nr:hypothetical protein [Actinacidiphila yanglinensis]SEG56428.1 hypothetical protein SAMN05216223_106276 [Actinacidiphila yanglinensis]
MPATPTTPPPVDTRRPHPFAASRPVGRVAVLRPVVVGLAVAAAFVTVFLAALHHPQPHGLPIAVTGPRPAVTAVEQGLDRQQPGGFRFTHYADPAAAVTAVQHRDIYGALDLSHPGAAHITLAGANGPGVTQTLTTAFTGSAHHVGAAATVTDTTPLPSGDSRGLAVFYYVFGVALSAFLFAMAFHQGAAGASLLVRVTVPLAFAVVTGALLTAVADAGFDAVAGHPWQVAAISAAISYAVATATMALTRVLHGLGIGVAGLIFIVIGNATSGGALNWHYLPGGWRWISQLLPGGAGVGALVDVEYFGARHLGPLLLALGVWIAAALLLLIALPALRLDVVHRRHAAERRAAERRAAEHAAAERGAVPGPVLGAGSVPAAGGTS